MANKKTSGGAKDVGSGESPLLFNPQSKEAINQLIKSGGFASVEELGAYMRETLAGAGLSLMAPQTPLEQAQDLIYDAWETTGKRRVQLARKALEVSSDCADAYVILAGATKDQHEEKALYEQGVAAGERAIGPKEFKNLVGNFWGFLETRPYMRARHGLALTLWELGERQQAIGHLTDMLRLNPGDNQGIRYILMDYLLAEGDDETVDKLLRKYKEEWSASWLYNRALWMFRRKRARTATDGALKKAFGMNPFVPLYLIGAKRIPRRLPDYIGIGDENEAIEYVAHARDNWVNTPGAMTWFVEIMERQIQEEKARI